MKETENVVIELTRYRTCFHNALVVDSELEKIQCKDCGEKLNPFFAIKKLMRLSEDWKRQKAQADLAREALEKKKRTKCMHCKKMTPVRFKVPLEAVHRRMEAEA